MRSTNLKNLVKDKKSELELSLLNEQVSLDIEISSIEIERLGLVLAGFYDETPEKTISVLGKREINYINSLDDEARESSLAQLGKIDISCIVVSDNIIPPKALVDFCNRAKIPLLNSTLSCTQLVTKLKIYLDLKLAPTIQIHGTVVDVYDVGMLFIGESGVGKSECALDLLAKGHRLVADDLVKLTKSPDGLLIASSASMLGHFMEIRGVGIIDLEKIFGLRAVSLNKKIDVEVQLVAWEKIEEFERIGIKERFKSHMGVKVPVNIIPLSPGKNITTIIEIIAMNFLLKRQGYNSAKTFIERLDKEMENK